MVKLWRQGQITYAGEVVAYDGSTFQAVKDTAQGPGGDDWVLIARGRRDATTPQVRGTYSEGTEYHRLDIVALNGSSFIAKLDDPGPCPGEGWQLLASAGRTGGRGEKGDRRRRARSTLVGEGGASETRDVGHRASRTFSFWASTCPGPAQQKLWAGTVFRSTNSIGITCTSSGKEPELF